MSPITPVFARPAPPRDIKFSSSQPIMRGGSEDGLLPKRGEKGDDFWRRFSMVVKEDQKRPYQSPWLKKTQNGTSRLSRWVWVIGLVLLLCIAGAIGLGWYASHNSSSNSQPKALGGSENEAAPAASSTAAATGSSTALHVTPTNTVQRRAHADVLPTDRPAAPWEHRRRESRKRTHGHGHAHVGNRTAYYF